MHLALALALFSSVLPASAPVVLQHYQLNIPRQPLDAALKAFANQTGLQVARMTDAVDGSTIVGPVSGELSAEEALKLLLGSDGLSYKRVNERTFAVFRSRAESHSNGAMLHPVGLVRRLRATRPEPHSDIAATGPMIFTMRVVRR
jgi:hypothetical protein